MEIFRQFTANNITLKEYPFWKELAMEAYLLENEEILKLDKNNFYEVSILDAEIALKQGRKSGNGRIDILAKYSGEYLAIVELKLNEINELSLIQLQDYLDQKEQILQFGNYWIENIAPKWVGVLVGSSISPELQEKLSTGYEYKNIPIAGITIRRFRSDKNEIFVVSDTYFEFNYATKDYSRFLFNGEEYNKGRLVNAVLKYYVEAHPDVSYPYLKNVFPDSIQGNFGVFNVKSIAEEIYQQTGHKRYYINPDMLIRLADESIATCTQWNLKNINEFIKKAKQIGIAIELK